ncbi:MAG TPA: formimidoylglutamate deiminase [Rhodanobacteraceae bacterium]|nr:formimidoylglutamate deiminase [Rhodanobacteraceae bacterium]
MLLADHLWTAAGWQRDVRVGASGDDVRARFVLPGMPNLHSHAFQRAMAGLAEKRGALVEKGGQRSSLPGMAASSPLLDSPDQGRSQEDTFWTWRETMYAFASRIGPDQLRAIAAQLYVEMLKAGYTNVCEFHYLHHAPDGKPYADPAAMSLAIIEAAKEAGIGLTLLPVLYMTGGFDGRPLSERQRRFGMDVQACSRLLENLRALEASSLRVGIALHSLRAVPEAAMREVLASPLVREGVIHIHIAEQTGEVDECVAARGARPVRWLLDHADVDARWCLVHATHLDEGEVAGIARSGAVAGLCPTTEANLGDGLFPLADYLDANGTLGIGSDSHVSVSPVEELRWLEYGQRLTARKRNIAARTAGAGVGEVLWKAAMQGGAQASGIAASDENAGLLVLDDQSPLLAARDERNVLDSFLFAGNTPLVRDVMANGEWVVRDRRHRDEERIAARFRKVVETLASG